MKKRDFSAWWYVAGGFLGAAAAILFAASNKGKNKRRAGRRVFTNVPTPVGGPLKEGAEATVEPFHEVTEPRSPRARQTK